MNPNWAKGIDISVYNAKITDWKAVAAAVDFVYIRGLYGTHADTSCGDHIKAARDAGIELIGVYGFNLIGDDFQEEADRLNYNSGLTLPVAADIETLNKHTKQEAQAWVPKLISALVLGGRRPVIYTGKYFWDDTAGITDNFGCDLFHAQYTSAQVPSISKAWPDWKLWQHHGDVFRGPDGNILVPAGSCPGIEGPVDCDVFNGTKDEMKAWANER